MIAGRLLSRRGQWLVPAVVLGACAASGPHARADDAPTYADRSATEVDDRERTAGLLLDPLAAATGVFGAEIDVVLGRHVALGGEGDVFAVTSGDVHAAFTLGVLVYPLRTAFRGLYLEPRVLYSRSLREPLGRIAPGADVLAFGGSAGWQWTWDYGLTTRLGAGAFKVIGERGTMPGVPIADTGIALALDGSVGWLF